MKAQDIKQVCKKGDMFRLGDHLLLCGDSTLRDSYIRLMGNDKAEMCITDPPYGVNYQSGFRKERFDVLKNDDAIPDFFAMVKEYSKGFFFCFCSVKSMQPMLDLFKRYFTLSNMIIWDKGTSSMGNLKNEFAQDYEIALVANDDKETIKLKRCGSIWRIPKLAVQSYLHPTQKPVPLFEFAIKRCTNNRAIVLDMFGGSGTTLLACENSGRRCRMIELDEHYCDVIIARWEEMTGKKAEKV